MLFNFKMPEQLSAQFFTDFCEKHPKTHLFNCKAIECGDCLHEPEYCNRIICGECDIEESQRLLLCRQEWWESIGRFEARKRDEEKSKQREQFKQAEKGFKTSFSGTYNTDRVDIFG